MESDDPCNALLLVPRSRKRQKHDRKQKILHPSKRPCVSKSQQRKLRRLREEKDKRETNAEVLASLEKHKLADNVYGLLHSSGTRGQRESMREKLRRAMQFHRAGLEFSSDVPLFRERTREDESLSESEPEAEAECRVRRFARKGDQEVKAGTQELLTYDTHTNGLVSAEATEDFTDGLSPQKGTDSGSTNSRQVTNGKLKKKSAVNSKKSEAKSTVCVQKAKEQGDRQEEGKSGTKKKEIINRANSMQNDVTTDGMVEVNVTELNKHVSESVQSCKDARLADVCARKSKFVVHVSRLEEVENTRKKLPIIMMEQEIMESINENPVTIICGETGCGKTTQVPQFLYEAAFSAIDCPERSGTIGVTQPRRVAVLATAKRVSYEMNVKLGQEVGFQVRHDRKIGENTRIKFMTDGILLREVQSDFLLRKYSVIILDEAHERSLNTDVLIGMLSRILRLRQTLYEEQCKSGKVSIFPLKLVIMSATLLVEDFVSNKNMFTNPPPIVQVPTRQFPVTIHFSAKTELLDYIGRAYKKVCAIHKRLPPGGVLVFVTGQAEVNYLCQKLRKAFPKLKDNKKGPIVSSSEADNDNRKYINDSMGIMIEDMADAADGGYNFHEMQDEVEAADFCERDDVSIGFSSETDDEVLDETDLPNTDAENRWDPKGSECLDAIKAAFDAFTGSEKHDKLSYSGKTAHCKVVGPLHVLPLYAMLPVASQLKVFGAVPEGSRLVVVATNVAETSITIPGIRYVVDCGRAKEKVYERGSGMTRYEIQWINKASAAQRAGRAGRTGPGHCYRLYSSAVYNDTFTDFSQPEICRAPLEGIVLLLKSMGIVQVNNFPFPSPLDQTALKEAEKSLLALAALDSTSNLLTPLGQALSVYPINPRHSRLLLTAMHLASSEFFLDKTLFLGYAAATAAALSLDSPFVMQMDALNDSVAGSLGNPENFEESKGNQKKLAHARFKHPLSDALSIVTALHAYETSGDPEEFCKVHYLHARIMHEMSQLRKQLVKLYLTFSDDICSKRNTPLNNVANTVEAAWKGLENKGLTVKQEQVLRQAICAGWADRVAHKVSLEDTIKVADKNGHTKRKTVHYQACAASDSVFLHPSSSLRKIAPEYVVYNELVCTTRPYMRVVTSVEAHWLVVHANALCTFSKPLSDPPPWYDTFSDDVFCWVSPSFGPYLWELPLQKCPLRRSKHRAAVFACALLQGKVLPAMATLHSYLAADPSILMSPGGLAHRRVNELIHAIGKASVFSRRKLKVVWDVQADFLFLEILMWVQKKSHNHLRRIWATLKQEAQLDGKLLFTKRKQRASIT